MYHKDYAEKFFEGRTLVLTRSAATRLFGNANPIRSLRSE